MGNKIFEQVITLKKSLTHTLFINKQSYYFDFWIHMNQLYELILFTQEEMQTQIPVKVRDHKGL